MGEQELFWVMSPVIVLASLTLLFARKAVYVLAGMIVVMIGLAVFYVTLEAPFLGMIQVIVYTGAIMMLILFVLMLVGVDQKESLRETIRGQRWIALAAATGLVVLIVTTVYRIELPIRDIGGMNDGGNPQVIANALFGEWVLVMEILGLVLISAAVSAIVLTHLPRSGDRRSQAERAEERVRARLNPVNKPMPGVYARRNALDVPAIDPEGKPVPASISRVLKARKQDKDGSEWRAIGKDEAAE
ncbi:MAG: NADH-quinone oxidoreductase subunit J [Demequinaceae bacterium]|nr:NADH-quinone oxidoreductase subunit J [Demequinaceae bacterium]